MTLILTLGNSIRPVPIGATPLTSQTACTRNVSIHQSEFLGFVFHVCHLKIMNYFLCTIIFLESSVHSSQGKADDSLPMDYRDPSEDLFTTRDSDSHKGSRSEW